ncbi:MAG: hypothetical protein U0M02_12865 [Acutalibacteraceae bacterium]|nr:hypothetical protein [Acutalibacteraceae bacterium]
MSTFFAVLGLISFLAFPIVLVILLVNKIRKNDIKKFKIALFVSVLGGFILFLLSYLTAESTWCEHKYKLVEEKMASCTIDGEIIYHCDLCDTPKIETIKANGHRMIEVSRTNPTSSADGFEISKCEICGFEETKILEKTVVEKTTFKDIITEKEKTTTKEKSTQPPTQPIVSFEEIYNEYKSNEVRADEKYKGNRYVISATVNAINNGGGLLNFDESINITLEKRVGNTIVFFYASFDKSQKDSLININVGDEITFEGTCYSAGNWDDCVLK